METSEQLTRTEALAQTGPFFIVLNRGSGRKNGEETQQIIDRVMREAGRSHEMLVVSDVRHLSDVAHRAVRQARENKGSVVVAGGDGTINAVAQAVLGSGCPFGVLPQGTFNYFGRTHGISEETEAATRQLLSAQIHPVQVGQVNDKIFLVNASLGLYPQVLQDREVYKKRYGRSRLVALWSAVRTVFLAQRQLHLRMIHGSVEESRRMLTLFVGNNRLQLEQIGIPLAKVLDEGELAALMLRPVGSLAMLGLMMRGALGRLDASDNVTNFCFRDLTVVPRSLYGMRKVKVATDGEVVWLRPPLRFKVADHPLLLLKPAPEPEPGAEIDG